jgi:hypothetical protein
LKHNKILLKEVVKNILLQLFRDLYVSEGLFIYKVIGIFISATNREFVIIYIKQKQTPIKSYVVYTKSCHNYITTLYTIFVLHHFSNSIVVLIYSFSEFVHIVIF